MTVNSTTPSHEEENTPGEQVDLREGEDARGGLMGEVFLEPEPAAVNVEPIDDDVQIKLRDAERRRLNLLWMFSAEEARELVADLEEVLDQLEAGE